MPESQSLRQSAVSIREKTNEKDENKDENERLPRLVWTLDVLKLQASCACLTDADVDVGFHAPTLWLSSALLILSVGW